MLTLSTFAPHSPLMDSLPPPRQDSAQWITLARHLPQQWQLLIKRFVNAKVAQQQSLHQPGIRLSPVFAEHAQPLTRASAIH